jgi:hypothetical protein
MNKAKRCFIFSGLLIATCLLTGCSGINYTKGISPATFLLPGLVNNDESNVDAPRVREDAAIMMVTQNL